MKLSKAQSHQSLLLHANKRDIPKKGILKHQDSGSSNFQNGKNSLKENQNVQQSSRVSGVKQSIEMIKQRSNPKLQIIPSASHKREVLFLQSFIQAHSNSDQQNKGNPQPTKELVQETVIAQVELNLNPRLLQPVRTTINLPPELHFSSKKNKSMKSSSRKISRSSSKTSAEKHCTKGFNKSHLLNSQQLQYSKGNGNTSQKALSRESSKHQEPIRSLKSVDKNRQHQSIIGDQSILTQIALSQTQEKKQQRQILQCIVQNEDKNQIIKNLEKDFSIIEKQKISSEDHNQILDFKSESIRYFNLQEEEFQVDDISNYPDLERYYIDLSKSNKKSQSNKKCFNHITNEETNFDNLSEFDLGFKESLRAPNNSDQQFQNGEQICPTISALNFSTIDFRSEFQHLQTQEDYQSFIGAKNAKPLKQRRRRLNYSQSSGQLSLLIEKIRNQNQKQQSYQDQFKTVDKTSIINCLTDQQDSKQENNQMIIQNYESQQLVSESFRSNLKQVQLQILKQKSQRRLCTLRSQMENNLQEQRDLSRDKISKQNTTIMTNFLRKPITPYRGHDKENACLNQTQHYSLSIDKRCPFQEIQHQNQSYSNNNASKKIVGKQKNLNHTNSKNDGNLQNLNIYHSGFQTKIKTKLEAQTINEYTQSQEKQLQRMKAKNVNRTFGILSPQKSFKILSPRVLNKDIKEKVQKYKQKEQIKDASNNQGNESTFSSNSSTNRWMKDNYEWLL